MDILGHDSVIIGVLFDLVFPPPDHWDPQKDVIDGMTLAIDEGVDQGLLDRPIEFVRRDVNGLPRGRSKNVVDAWKELADAGAILIFGPMITENAVVLREHVESSGHIPTLSWCGSEDFLGEWCFELSDGSLSEEPFYIANMIAGSGYRRVGVCYERSAIGTGYLSYFRQACDVNGLEIVATAPIAQTIADSTDAVTTLKASNCDAIVHLGFGFGLLRINEALEKAEWDPPRFMSTAWEGGFLSNEIFASSKGWIGLEHYDEGNLVGQAVLDRFDARYGRRPEYAYPLYGFDVGNVIVHALAYAEPLSPAGVLRGLERVKFLEAASGSAGTRISYGKWKRNGWHGPGYMTAREVAPDLKSTILRGRYDGPVV